MMDTFMAVGLTLEVLEMVVDSAFAIQSAIEAGMGY